MKEDVRSVVIEQFVIKEWKVQDTDTDLTLRYYKIISSVINTIY